jgi:hypothetical protein
MRRRRGVEALEFALILPFWFTIVAGVMDFGWLMFNIALLDLSSNTGCRAGSLMDPGNNDERMQFVREAVTGRMQATFTSFGMVDCDTCELDAWTVGAPPRRSLMCQVSREVEPLTHLFFETRVLTSTQVSRLEWQREAAPQ